MPVLPEVASTTVMPGLSSPAFSAASMTPSARRSLTEPSGLKASILTNRLMPFGPNLLMRTTGVLPMVPKILSNFAIETSQVSVAPAREARRLHVQHTPISIEHRFLHHLRQSRVREDGVHQFFFSGLQVHGHHIALD